MDRAAYLADQDKAIVQAEAAAAEIMADGFASTRADLQAAAGFSAETWAKKVRALAAEAREVKAARDAADLVWRNANAQVRDLVPLANRWRTEGFQALEVAELQRVPGAADARRLVSGLPMTADTYEAQVAEMQTLLRLLADEPALLAAATLSADWVAQGEALVRQLLEERNDVDEVKAGRMSGTLRLHGLLRELAHEVALYDAVRRLATTRLGRELPGFDLTYVRAVGAAVDGGEAATSGAAPTPEATEARGL